MSSTPIESPPLLTLTLTLTDHPHRSPLTLALARARARARALTSHLSPLTSHPHPTSLSPSPYLSPLTSHPSPRPGELDRDEFLCLLHQLFPANCDDNEAYVDREFAAADADRSRTLSFVEFERYYPQVT